MRICPLSVRNTLCLFALCFSLPVFAQAPIPGASLTPSKANKDYVSVGLSMMEFRSIDLLVANTDTGQTVERFGYQKAQTYAFNASIGTYITDHFKTELRFGTGVRSDTIKDTLEIQMDYWAGWYIGGTHPITDYMSAYGLYGVTHYAADVTRRERVLLIVEDTGFGESVEPVNVIPSRTVMEEDLFATSFSTSWILGLDFDLTDDLFLAFEYGKLLRDTDTNIKVRQAGISLRYEY